MTHPTRPRNAARWLALGAAAAIASLTLTGCSLGGEQAQQVHEAEPGTIVRVLPSRPGLTPDGPPASVDAAGFATALLGHPDADLTASLERAGFRRGATRSWSGANGAALTAVVGLWDDGEPADSIDGDAVNAVVPGGAAWTPSEFGGSQGSHAGTARALSVVVGHVSLFIRATGPVDDATLLRQMDLMYQVAAGQDRAGSSSGG